MLREQNLDGADVQIALHQLILGDSKKELGALVHTGYDLDQSGEQ
jgi:hypothetical protein